MGCYYYIYDPLNLLLLYLCSRLETKNTKEKKRSGRKKERKKLGIEKMYTREILYRIY
jgi:hypothetical protein